MHCVCVYVCVCWGRGVGQGSASALPSGLGWAQLWKTVPLGREEPGSVVPGSPMFLWGPASIFISEPQSVELWEWYILGPEGALGKEELSTKLDEWWMCPCLGPQQALGAAV